MKRKRLVWFIPACLECDQKFSPTPDVQHAQELADTHEHDAAVVTVKLAWHLPSCPRRGCSWLGNPTPDLDGAKSQLAAHAESHEG